MKKFLALVLAILMVLSLAACGNKVEEEETETEATENQTEATEKATEENKNDENKNENENTDNGGNKAPANDEEIFKYIMDAFKATKNHSGDITTILEAKESYKDTYEGETDITYSAFKAYASLDSIGKVVYSEESYDSDYDTNTSIGKTFYKDGALYGAQNSTYVSKDDSDEGSASEEDGIGTDEGVAEEVIPVAEDEENSEDETSFFGIHESFADSFTSLNNTEAFEYMNETFKGIQLAETFAEVENAYKTATPVLLKAIYCEGYENADPAIEYDVSVKATDGVYTLVISVKSSYEATNEGKTTKMMFNVYNELSAKDGKIIAYKQKNETLMDDGSSKYETSTDISLEINYTFAKDKYDAFEVNVPEDLSDVYVMGAPATELSDVYLSVYVNGVDIKDTIDLSGDEGNTYVAFDEIAQYFTDLTNGNANIQVFMDEEMTKELPVFDYTDATQYRQALLAMTDVYAKITPKDGYALVVTKHTVRDDYSKEYKIVMPMLYYFSSSSSLYGEDVIVTDLESYDFKVEFVNSDNREIWVDGVKVEQGTENLNLEAGKTYMVEYVLSESEKDFMPEVEE